MAGVKGAGGAIPKRSNQRRRRNKPDVEVEQAPGAELVPVPKARRGWHPVAKQWFESLAASGQAAFYEPSDWATAIVVAESISRELRPQETVTPSGKVVMVERPPTGAALSAFLRACSVLMVTEGDRRRLRLELQRPQPVGEEAGGDVSELDAYRQRIRDAAG